MKKDYYSDYKNVKDYLNKNNYISSGSIYQNIFVKDKLYYRESNKNPDKDTDKLLGAGLKYNCLTLFGKLLAFIGAIGIYFGVYTFIILACLLTFNFYELVDKENYEVEMAEDLWHEIFVGMMYSHNSIGNCYSFDIPYPVPFDMYRKYIRYREHLRKFYTKKSPEEKQIINKFLYGADYVALKNFGLLNEAWENKGKYMLNNRKDTND